MITAEQLLAEDKGSLSDFAQALSPGDISVLTDLLAEKDDELRYRAFLVLRARSKNHDDVYPYMDLFRAKLNSGNSYQRSIGLMLISANAKWAPEEEMKKLIDAYLAGLGDEKPITVRQCVQALEEIVPYHEALREKIADRLMSVEIASFRPTMQKLVLLDILNILILLQKTGYTGDTEAYIQNALTGGLLGDKEKKQILAMRKA